MKRARRALAAVAMTAVAALSLSGCLYALIPEERPAATSTAAPDTEGVAADLLPFYEQTVSWSSCGSLDCATLTAPLDWNDPEAGEIDLGIIRSRAEGGDAVGSLLLNPGGPGSSGIELVRESLNYAVGSRIAESYDVIGFDPRGVGESTPVRCLDGAEMDDYLFGIPEDPRGSAEWEAELDQRNAAFAEACEAGSDGILPYITTEQSARDMDLIRAVLGDRALNYLGYSYGTFLGATYAKLYPEKVGRLVLDGAIDPAIPGLDVGTTQAIGFESALRAYMADCLEDQDCPFRGTVDDGMADLGSLLASVDENPLPGGDGRMLGADALTTAIVAALYSQDSWSFLSQALTAVLQGDADPAFYLADFYYNRVDGQYLDNSTEAFRAYNCMDYPLDATPEQEAAAEALISEKAPTIAPYWIGPDPCESWPHEATGVREPITADGAAPILVVGTTNDPATPYEWSVSLAAQLSSGILVTREGEGHTGYNKGNACVDGIVEDYLIHGDVPESDRVCN
ncbi:alpha/beta hydrolase [Microbacterium aureliae]